jgi:hypothetical protein
MIARGGEHVRLDELVEGHPRRPVWVSSVGLRMSALVAAFLESTRAAPSACRCD